MPDSSGDIRVLVADDNEDVATILEALLNAEDGLACVGRLGDAQAVVAEARRVSAQVLLLDLKLNGVSGIDVLRECRSAVPGLVVVILSGHSEPRLQKEARNAGAADYLVKPDDLAGLGARLRALL